MLKTNDLRKTFRTEEIETVALDGVSLHVAEGEFIAIMGPSGCGKSTLLNILGLLDNPTSGDYLLAGTEVGHLKEKQRTDMRKGNIGFVFQSFNLIEEMNVYENVELPLVYMKVKQAERKKKGGRNITPNEYQSSRQTFSQSTFGGATTTCSHSTCCDCQPETDPGR